MKRRKRNRMRRRKKGNSNSVGGMVGRCGEGDEDVSWSNKGIEETLGKERLVFDVGGRWGTLLGTPLCCQTKDNVGTCHQCLTIFLFKRASRG